MQAVGAIFIFVFFIFVSLGLGWVIQGNDFFMARYFNPRYEAVRRDTMIQSRAYVEGETRRLYEFKRELEQAHTDTERDSIKAFARHEIEGIDISTLPPDLQAFALAMRQ